MGVQVFEWGCARGIKLFLAYCCLRWNCSCQVTFYLQDSLSLVSTLSIRYFHPPVENAIGLVVGAILFQAPTVLFNLKCLQSAYLVEKRGAETEFLTSNGRAHVSPPKVQ